MPDLDKLQGTWHVTSLELDGRPAAASSLAGTLIVVSGATFTSRMADAAYEGTISLGPSKSPKTFDLLFTTGPQKGTSHPGIYKLAGDTWTICFAMHGTARPKRFATRPGSGLALETLRRAGALARPARGARAAASSSMAATAPPAATPASSAPPTELEGEWTMTKGVFNGVPLAPELVAYCKRVTHGDITRVAAGPQIMLEARFTLDRAASPRAIDYMNLAGSHKGKAQAGIYALEGKTLTISVSAPGHARPDSFSTRKGDGRTLTVWTRGRK